jgi:tRNA 5-methylaminomethyl-2-thiouridine biosynthesis bifunctional protein
LAGEVLAAAVVGAPQPVAGSLLDAVDPARFVARLARHAAA